VLHVLQPMARLWGRLQHGLTPWKRHGSAGAIIPYRRESALWTESWIDPHERLRKLEQDIAQTGLTVWRGNAYEPWDLEVVGGLLGSARALMAIEDHGSGRQYVRLAAWPRYSKLAVIFAVVGAIIAGGAAMSQEFVIAGLLVAGSALLLGGALLEAGRSLATVCGAGQKQEPAAVYKESPVTLYDSSPSRHSVEGLKDALQRTGTDV
jgi:O-antigen biosynthesis protein